ncbi:MAG TPA: XdhC family protein, partial [Candidatus Limnocylindrales bacterium]|nr:XdhC family protein [Candidatus Limnocylindrales bacterium]
GAIAGSVSGGCVEGAAAELIAESRRDGLSRVVRFGISDEQAWDVGLACGSTIDVLIEPQVRDELVEAARGAVGTAIITSLPDGSPDESGGRQQPASAVGAPVHVLGLDGAASITPDLAAAALALAAQRHSGTVTDDGRQFFVETFAQPPRVVVFGAVQAAIPLIRMAREMGYRTVVADAREAFASRERFPDADELVVGWPDEIRKHLALTPDDAVVVMTHDPKLDEPAIVEAVRAGCSYVGAMGSRRTQAGRRERLAAAGLSPEQIDSVRGPIGLDLGGREAGEMALAILAEIVAARNDGTGRPLRDIRGSAAST